MELVLETSRLFILEDFFEDGLFVAEWKFLVAKAIVSLVHLGIGPTHDACLSLYFILIKEVFTVATVINISLVKVGLLSICVSMVYPRNLLGLVGRVLDMPWLIPGIESLLGQLCSRFCLT